MGDSSGSGPRASFQEEEEPEGGDAGDATDPAPADVAPVAEEDGSQEPVAEEDGVQEPAAEEDGVLEPAAEEDGAEEPAAEEDGVLEGGEEDAAGTGDPESSTGEGAEGEGTSGEGEEGEFDRSAIVDDDGDPTTDGYRADQAIVRLTAGADIGAYNERHDTRVISAIPARNVYLLQLPAGSDEPTYVGALSANPDTVWAELNFIGQAPEGRPGRFFVSGTPASSDPTAAYAPSLIGVEDAWTCTTGAGVTVAVLDTGVDASHPALAGRVSGGGWNVLENSPGAGDLGNGIDDDGDGYVDEMTGHGTHVSGIVAQAAPDAAILPIKALDSDGVGDAFYLAAGLYYALDNGADVINLSLGSTYDARVVAEATGEVTAAGAVVVAAAGNADRQNPAEYPATGGDALGVASTNGQDLKSGFSNYHPVLTISSPGSDIVSAFPGGGYVSWSGTSMATPWVSGAAALLLGEDPGLGMSGVAGRLNAAAVSLNGSNPNYTGLLGAGRLDAGAAVGCGSGGTSSTQSTGTDGGATSTGTATVANTGGVGANCRAAADPAAKVLTVLPEGSEVSLAGDVTGEWQPVTCAGATGYVSTAFLSYS